MWIVWVAAARPRELDHMLAIQLRELPELRILADAEVHMSGRLIRQSCIQKLLHQLDHSADLLAGLWIELGRQNVQGLHVSQIALSLIACQIRGVHPQRLRLVKQGIVHVCDVLHISNAVPQVL